MTALTTALEHSPGSLLVSRTHVDLRRQASAICPARPGCPDHAACPDHQAKPA